MRAPWLSRQNSFSGTDCKPPVCVMKENSFYQKIMLSGWWLHPAKIFAVIERAGWHLPIALFSFCACFCCFALCDLEFFCSLHTLVVATMLQVLLIQCNSMVWRCFKTKFRLHCMVITGLKSFLSCIICLYFSCRESAIDIRDSINRLAPIILPLFVKCSKFLSCTNLVSAILISLDNKLHLFSPQDYAHYYKMLPDTVPMMGS